MSTFVQFQPSAQSPFNFTATLSNGVTYQITALWNIFGERFYIQVTDLSGNLIYFRALTAGGPTLQAALTWNTSTLQAVATTVLPHNVPVGSVVGLRISKTGTAFDGNWQALATGPNTLTYTLSNPNQSAAVSGTVSFPLNLVSAPNIGYLLFHYETQQFEY